MRLPILLTATSVMMAGWILWSTSAPQTPPVFGATPLSAITVHNPLPTTDITEHPPKIAPTAIKMPQASPLNDSEVNELAALEQELLIELNASQQHKKQQALAQRVINTPSFALSSWTLLQSYIRRYCRQSTDCERLALDVLKQQNPELAHLTPDELASVLQSVEQLSHEYLSRLSGPITAAAYQDLILQRQQLIGMDINQALFSNADQLTLLSLRQQQGETVDLTQHSHLLRETRDAHTVHQVPQDLPQQQAVMSFNQALEQGLQQINAQNLNAEAFRVARANLEQQLSQQFFLE